jgi:hypothetical protein
MLALEVPSFSRAAFSINEGPTLKHLQTRQQLWLQFSPKCMCVLALNVIKRQCMAARRLAPATAAAAGVAPTTCEAALHLGSGQDAAIKDNSGIAGVLVCVYVCCKSV